MCHRFIYKVLLVGSIAGSLACGPGGSSVNGGIDGANTEVSAAQRLADYRELSRYPDHSRPAHAEVPARLADWPGLPERTLDDAKILDYAGEESLRAGSLFVKFRVAVSEAGRYSFTSVLYPEQGTAPLLVSTLTRDLPAGQHTLEFEYFGLILRESLQAADAAAPQSFQIRGILGERLPTDAELEELVSGARAESPEGRLVIFEKKHTTRSYRAEQFRADEWDAPEKRARIAELEAEVRAEQQAE